MAERELHMRDDDKQRECVDSKALHAGADEG